MKKITKLSILLATLALASSCQDEAGLNPPQPMEITLAASSAETKTLLDGGSVKWENGDEIAMVFTHATEDPAVHAFSTSIESPAASADFKGTLPAEVIAAEGGYHEQAYAVYPGSAVGADGSVAFTLPSVQNVRADGTFASGLNLTSAPVSLADIQNDGNASATFLNAMSIIRFTLSSDITSVTLTGTAPLAGKAPLEFNADGRLVVDGDGQWTGASYSVTLLPADGASNFTDEQEVNLLVWPGSHTEITATLSTKSLGDISKTSTQEFTFSPSKYYTLDFNVNTETLVNELDGRISGIEGDIASLEQRIKALETNAEKIKVLVDQIQSVALMSEYLENSAFAYYAQQSVGMLKMDINLQYIVRPAAAMSLLLEICKKEGNLSEVLSMMCDNRNGSFSTLNIKDAMLDGDILTVVVGGEQEQFDRNFYDGITKVSLALQISDGNSDILSDFVNLIPKVGTILNIARTDDIPVLKGASFSMSYQYGADDYSKCQVSLTSQGFSTSPTISADNGHGVIRADFGQSANLAGMSMTITLKYEGQVADVKTLTFADGGTFTISTPASVDYIGGEVSVDVTSSNFSSYTMMLSGAGDWIYETSSGVSGRYSLNQNNGSQRSANVVVTITNGNISYSKSVTITQKATGTSLTGSYYSNGEKLTLNQKTASCADALNIVILGDGYQKKDLLKGGKFERSARSAMDSFFGIEPFKSFKDRFNVYMVAYESTDEGVDIKASSVDKNTYFNTYCQGGGNTAAYADDAGVSKIQGAVKNIVGSSDAQYYRTIAIVLANTSEQAGSCGYPFRDYKSGFVNGYASFAIAVLAANSTGTNGLVKHEAGGHAFGRLADEYNNGGTASSSNKTDLSNWHAKGWYWNVNPSNSGNYYMFTNSAYSSEVSFIEGAWGYAYGMYRPTQGGMMQSNTGEFNAPSRHAIYHRIITESEGSSAYSWNKFLEYDRRNRNK